MKTGDVTNVNIEDNKIKFILKDGKEFYAIKEPGQNMNDNGMDGVSPDTNKLKIQVEDTESSSFWVNC